MASDDKPEKNNRPENSDFKQQRLKAWQPILTPGWVIATFLSVGVVFLAIGIAVLVTSNSVSEQTSEDYTEIANPSGCSDNKANTHGGSCIKDFSMTLESDMDSPVYMYFELTNFYQNHRRYVKSRNDNQLMSNDDVTKTDMCSPLDKTNGATLKDIPVYPCGLIAWSAFNDTVYALNTNGEYYQNTLAVITDGGTACSSSTNCKFVTTTSEGIAWSSDRNEKFEKITNCGGNAVLDSTVSPSIAMPYNTFKYYTCKNGESTCSIASEVDTSTACFDKVAPAAVGGTGTTITTCQQSERCGDVSNEEFIVWMRTSGLPTFRKLYRVINTDLKKGETIKFSVNDVFPVTAFSGSKKIVLSTTAWIGGKNTFLGAAYITVACICIVLGIGFAVKHLKYPRQPAEAAN